MRKAQFYAETVPQTTKISRIYLKSALGITLRTGICATDKRIFSAYPAIAFAEDNHFGVFTFHFINDPAKP